MEQRLMTVAAALVVSTSMAFAQSQISGTVTSSEDGSPVIGASVKIVGTKTGTVTDVDGNFSLNAPAGAKLEVTYLGMLPQTVKAGQKMKIVLEADNKTLDEVVVTAMGISRDKKALGYASQKLGAEDLNTAGTSLHISYLPFMRMSQRLFSRKYIESHVNLHFEVQRCPSWC